MVRGECWTASPAREDCRKRLFWTTFRGRAPAVWSEERRVPLEFIQRGKSAQDRKLQRSAADECLHGPERCKNKNRKLAAGLQSGTLVRLSEIELRTALRIRAGKSGDAGMRGFSKQGTQAPSSALGLIPAEIKKSTLGLTPRFVQRTGTAHAAPRRS
jgi:hypothetical protein